MQWLCAAEISANGIEIVKAIIVDLRY